MLDVLEDVPTSVRKKFGLAGHKVRIAERSLVGIAIQPI
jgi:hypothetical protein